MVRLDANSTIILSDTAINNVMIIMAFVLGVNDYLYIRRIIMLAVIDYYYILGLIY